MIMRSTLLKAAAFALCAAPLSAQSADSLIAKFIQASGGMARIQALQSLRRTGKFTGGGGFEAVGEEEMHGILDDADFDGPLVNYQAKGNRVEYQGIEQVEGSDAYKLKVTRPNGDISFYYLDTEYYVPIRIDTQRMIRGAPQEFETSLGDYKQVAGVYLPFSTESGPKGSSSADRGKITYKKIEANVPLDDQRFA